MISPQILLDAYAVGLFPMADHRSGKLAWYSPDPRAVIPLDGFHVPRSLRRLAKKNIYRVTMNADFHRVIRGCALRRETWISPEIIESYTALHTMGFAHSIECWEKTRLAGGLYGVSINGAFFGESMFSELPESSKIALVYLVTHLRNRGFTLLDTQFLNPHVEMFGATEIPRSEYIVRLKNALKVPVTFMDVVS
jgi:leucyl/phenylalanyl-tRNA--protein transferase